MGTCKGPSDFSQGSRTPSTEFNDKSSSNFEEDFQSNMSVTSGFYAFVDPTNESNDLELLLDQPRSINHHPPATNTFNDSDHITLNTSYSSTIYGPQFCDLSSNAALDWYGSSVADSSNNSWINSDITINYLNKLLMDEDDDDKVKLRHGEEALRAMEEPFYRILGQNSPAYPESPSLCSCDHLNSLDDSISKSERRSSSSCSVAIDSSNNHSNHNLQAFEAPWSLSDTVKETKRSTEGTKNMELGVKIDGLSIAERCSRDNRSLQVNVAHTRKHASSEVNCGNYSSTEYSYLLEERSSKQVAFSFNGPTRDEMFDRVLLFSEHKPMDEAIVLQEMMTNKSTGHSQNEQGRTSARWKTRGKKQQKKEVVDLRTILIHCAEAVSANNHTLANDMLNIIRQHSSITGNDTQRLAFCLADCLEVRLAGTGTQLFHNLITKITSDVGILKVFQLSLAVTPFARASIYFSNKTILDVSKGKSKVHIIDFGICFGFQWPSLFEQLAKREDGPPKVRITGIELPKQGFRPNQMNKQNTGQRLADYASMFNVPFEYQAISSKWETICIEDLNIQEDDVLIVNCLGRMKNLGDETVSINSARNRVLNTIRMMKPKVFVHGVVNGSYSTPFFLTRFKEVMYHYSALFDIFDKMVPRDNETRTMLIERGIFQYHLVNVIACEGSERMEKQGPLNVSWHGRMFAGLRRSEGSGSRMSEHRTLHCSLNFYIDYTTQAPLHGRSGCKVGLQWPHCREMCQGTIGRLFGKSYRSIRRSPPLRWATGQQPPSGMMSGCKMRLSVTATQQLQLLQNELLSVTLSQNPDCRTSFFAKGKSGIDSGSIYRMLKARGQPDSPTAIFVWNNHAPPRVKLFMWLLTQDRIQSRSVLLTKKIVDDVACEVCQAAAETPSHIIAGCPLAVQFWSALNLPQVLQTPATQLHLVTATAQFPEQEFPMFLALGCWHLWKARNAKVFDNRSVSLQQLILECKDAAKLWKLRLPSKDKPIADVWCLLLDMAIANQG